MANIVGMDTAAVRQLGQDLKAQAATIESIAQAINGVVDHMGQVWQGRDAESFRGWWEQQHRPAMQKISELIGGLGQSALNNAGEQDTASGQAPQQAASGPGHRGGALPVVGALRALAGYGVGALGLSTMISKMKPATAGRLFQGGVRDLQGSSVVQRLSSIDARGGKYLDGAGKALSFLDIGEDGLHARDHAQAGDALGVTTDAGEAAGTALKMSHTPVTYVAGVATLIFTDDIKAARDIGLSHLDDIPSPFSVDNFKNIWVPSFTEATKTVFGRIPGYLL